MDTLLAATGARTRARPWPGEVRATPASTPPPWWRVVAEAASPLEAARLLAATGRLARMPRGDGQVVVDIPGWRAPEASTAAMRRYLSWLGYDARGWGMGSAADPLRDARRLAVSVARLAEQSGRPVSLVGWSLGGAIAREVARERPDAVHRVVTYGTPVVGGPAYTAFARGYSLELRDRILRAAARLEARRPIDVPVTVVYSRRDGIVSWRACLDRSSPRVEHVEVRSTHLGMGLDPDVWAVVAGRLADAAGRAGA